MWETLKRLAPTVAGALGTPLAGAFIAGLGEVFGQENPTLQSVEKVFKSAQLTPDQIVKIKELELKAQQDEREGQFKYAELAFKDRDSARKANVDGGIQGKLFFLSLVLICITLGTEVYVLFMGYPADIPDIVVGRVLGLMDAVAMMVLTYYYGTSSGSQQNRENLSAMLSTK